MKTIQFSNKGILKLTLSGLLILIFSVNGFAQTWDYKNSGTDFLLFDLSIPQGQNDVAYAAGSEYTVDSEGIIIKTEDGGESWSTILSGTSHSFTKIEFITPLRGFAVGWGNTFISTEDGGATWQDVTAGTNTYYYSSLSFYDENLGFAGAITNSNTVEGYITTDGGVIWNLVSDTSNMAEFSACFADENTLFSVGRDQTVSKSVDTGESWSVLSTGINGYYNFRVFFKDVDNGILSTEDGTLLTTHDSGITWDTFSTGYHNFYGLNYKGDNIFATGTDQDVFHSIDNGANWTFVHDGPPIATFYAIEFFEDNSVLICGSQGTILKGNEILSNPDNETINSELKIIYSPIEKNVIIQSNLSEVISSIELYGMDGKLIFTTKDIAFDVSSLQDGLYITLIRTSGTNYSVKFNKY